jgi:hypothetical protein
VKNECSPKTKEKMREENDESEKRNGMRKRKKSMKTMDETMK